LSTSKSCPNCSEPTDVLARYCPSCGQALEASDESTVSTSTKPDQVGARDEGITNEAEKESGHSNESGTTNGWIHKARSRKAFLIGCLLVLAALGGSLVFLFNQDEDEAPQRGESASETPEVNALYVKCAADLTAATAVFLEFADDTSFQQATNAVIDEYGTESFEFRLFTNEIVPAVTTIRFSDGRDAAGAEAAQIIEGSCEREYGGP